MKEKSEENLVIKIRQGDSAAVGELYCRYWRAARATAYGVIGDLNLAEDAASEAFYIALENLQTLKDTYRFGPWLNTIVVRTAIRLKTSQSKRKDKELEASSKTWAFVSGDVLEERELVVQIRESVEELPDILREAVCLFYFEGYSIEKASQFLDVHTGTFKRRLHDGRVCLRNIIENILKGEKTANLKKEQILKKLNDFIKSKGSSKYLHKILRQVFTIRPLPIDLLSKLIQQRSKTAKKLLTCEGRNEVEQRARKVMTSLYQMSPRMQDTNHPIGKTASLIREALPDFKEWQIDISSAAQSVTQRLSGDFNHLYLPPGYTEGIPGAYIYAVKGSLIRTKDGSFCTMYELLESKNAENVNDTEPISNNWISDTLILMWMQMDVINLCEVENLLQRLLKIIAPKRTSHFSVYKQPSYRSALRMQIEDIAIPSAIGGILNPLPNLIEKINIAQVQIYLEPWAMAQSGEVVELIKLSSLMRSDLLPKLS